MNHHSQNLLVALFLSLPLNGLAGTVYVDLNSPSPASPYSSWATAATNIQDAVDAAATGDLVLVTNGVYRTGGMAVFGTMTNRVAVTKAITLQSVNGPNVTIIQGFSPSGPNAVRCAYLTNQAQLIGFTLTNGATLLSGDLTKERSGGGVWCESLASPASLIPVISNCVIVANSAIQNGGGAYNGKYIRCVIRENTAFFGGGANGGYFQSCLILGNNASSSGGGLNSPSSVFNCTIVSNSCQSATGAGGLTINGTVKNSIIYYNTNTSPAGSLRNYSGSSVSLRYCNTISIPPTIIATTITNAPLFVNPSTGDFRLLFNSSCINAGNNVDVADTIDLRGDNRVIAGTVDIGAYEFQSATSQLSYAWAQQFGLLTDGTADFSDNDGDGMSNYGEWRSDTVPTNALSVLRIVGVTNTVSGIQITWNCVSSRVYYMERATNLALGSSFQNINNFLGGSASPTRSYTDTTATNSSTYFYRVGVQ
jgi:hypothetical protein